MKKVSLLILVSILLLLAFSSCTLLFEEQLPDYSQQGHVHEYGENWITDDAGHLHECECGAEKDYALHYDDNADMLCDACGADMPLPNVQYVVTVIATDEDGKLFFGNSLVVQHGDDATFDLMVGVEYTLSVSEGATIVATTTANGYKTYTFIVENVTADVTVSVSSEICKHEWLDPTCVAPAICDICGLTEGDPLGHNYSSVATPPTCIENGYDTYTCGVCEDSYSVDTLDALGHSAADPVEENRTEPTCT